MTYLGSFSSNGAILLLKRIGILLVVLLHTLHRLNKQATF